MNKKALLIVGVVIIIIIIAVAANKKATINSSNGPVKIGIIMPLTGPAAALGEASKKAVDLALSHLTDEQRAKIEIVYGDDQFDTKQTVSVANKLITVDGVKALIAYSSPTSVVASYEAEKNSIPMIGLGNASEINTGKQWVTRYMLGPVPQAKAIENLLLKGKYKNIALMWNQSDGPKFVQEQLAKMLPADGFNLVANESVAKGENDFKTSISKIRTAKPDVVVAYISPQIGVFAKQAKDLQLSLPIVSGPTFEIFDQIKAAQGGLDNQLYVGNDNAAFIDEFYAKYNTYPTIAGDYLYDAVTQLARVYAGGNVDSASVVASLRKDFTGVSGAYKYNGDGSFDITQVVKKWDGAKYVVVK